MTDVSLETVDDYRGAGVVLRSAYDPDVVQITKARLHRSYDPATKTWFIAAAEVDGLKSELTAAGHRVFHDQPVPVAEPKRQPALPGVGSFFGIDDDDDFDATGTAAKILESIPPMHRGKVLRAMAKAMFPDLYPRPPR